MTEPDEEPRAWVQWDDGTWSTLDAYGMPSERQSLDELFDSFRRGSTAKRDTEPGSD